MFLRRSVKTLAKVACAITLASACPLLADSFTQTNLVSNIPNFAAVTDPNLKSPWGVSFTATSPFWASNQVTGNSTLYNGAGVITPLVVTIPGGNPTGQVSNAGGTGTFLVNGTAASFIFDTL